MGVATRMGEARPIATPGPAVPSTPEVPLARVAGGAPCVGEGGRLVVKVREPLPRVGRAARYPIALDVPPSEAAMVPALPRRPPPSGGA